MLTSDTVLVVESDPISRELLENVLRTGGFEVLATPSGASALLTLSQQRSQIDWLVTCVSLPGLVDGWILADEYQQQQAGRPVIMLTEPIFDAACPSIDALFIPPTAPMRVLEALKGLIVSQRSAAIPVPQVMLPQAA